MGKKRKVSRPKADKYLVVPFSLYDRIKEVADEEGKSITEAARLLLERGVESHKKEPKSLDSMKKVKDEKLKTTMHLKFPRDICERIDKIINEAGGIEDISEADYYRLFLKEGYDSWFQERINRIDKALESEKQGEAIQGEKEG